MVRTCAELATNVGSVKGAVMTVPMRKIPEDGEEEEEYDSEDEDWPMETVQLPAIHMLEKLNGPGLVPLPEEPVAVELADEEDDLPMWEGEDSPPPATAQTVGQALSSVVDVLVVDDPSSSSATRLFRTLRPSPAWWSWAQGAGRDAA